MAFPALPVTWSLDGFEFNVGPDSEGHSAIVDVQGWTSPPGPKPKISERVEDHGAYRGPNYRSSKVVRIQGTAQAETPTDRETLLDRLAGLCLEPGSTYPLTCNNPRRPAPLTMWVEHNDAPSFVELRDGLSVSVDIQLIAVDPWKYSPDNPTQSTGMRSVGADGILWNGSPSASGGIEWNGSPTVSGGLIYQSGSGTAGVIRLTNTGNRPAPVVLEITATAVNPQIDVIQTSQRLRWVGTVGATSVLRLDSKNKSAFLDNINVGGTLSDADWFDVPANGFIDLVFTGDASSTGATLFATNANVQA